MISLTDHCWSATRQPELLVTVASCLGVSRFLRDKVVYTHNGMLAMHNLGLSVASANE
jgi:hypothetical protein